MLLPDKKSKFKGWQNPRLIKSESYYRFTNNQGLDSVSDQCQYHFSWSDWINLIPTPQMPLALKNCEIVTDTLKGKYSPTEIWNRNRENVSVDINILADTLSRKWVTNLRSFFNSNLEYENFRLRYNYNNVVGDSIALTDITGYSYNIESNGRGHNMFRFNKAKEPFFVSTYAEIYITDKEFIKIKEAKKWANINFSNFDITIIEPTDAPEKQEYIKKLIGRVNDISHNTVRQKLKPDYRLKGRGPNKQHLGQRMLSILKGVTGISSYKSRKKFERNWNNFKMEQMNQNQQ